MQAVSETLLIAVLDAPLMKKIHIMKLVTVYTKYDKGITNIFKVETRTLELEKSTIAVTI